MGIEIKKSELRVKGRFIGLIGAYFMPGKSEPAVHSGSHSPRAFAIVCTFPKGASS